MGHSPMALTFLSTKKISITMKKILYDLSAVQPNASTKMHGGGKYGIVVFKELMKRPVEIEAVYHSSKYLPEEIVDDCKKIKLYDLDHTDLATVVKSGTFDIYYSALPGSDIALQNIKIRYIGTMHGLRKLEMPHDWNFLRYRQSLKQIARTLVSLFLPNMLMKRELRKYDSIISQKNFSFITVSNHTKASILNFYPSLKEENLKVFYSPLTIVQDDVQPYSTEKYFLLVSANRPEKNALRAVMALDELMSEREEFKNFKVYLTGAKEGVFKYKIKNPDNFIFLGYVSEEDLARLYRGAYCFIYPSLNEGFGYPPMEAMNYGVPVLASSFASIYEVCDNAVLYFNPLDYKEIKNRIIQIVYTPSLYRHYQELGKKRTEVVHAQQDKDLKEMVDWICGE